MENKRTQKLRLLYFVPQFPVLTETFIASEASKLVSRGNIDLQVFSLAKGSGETPANLAGRVKYERISFGDVLASLFILLTKDPKRLFTAFKLVCGADRIPLLISLSGVKPQPKNYLSFILSNSRVVQFFKGLGYSQLFKTYNPDHIHAHFLSETSTIIMVAAHILDIPFSVSAHAKDVFVEGTLIATKAKYAKFISVCNGNTWKKVVDLANQTKSSRNIRLIFHGVEHEKIENATNKTHPGLPFIFTIARLVEKKGLVYLLEASRILKERGVKHTIKIAGPGPMYNELCQKIQDLQIADCVEILGGGNGIPNVDILGYVKIADMFVLPFIETTSGDVDGVPYSVIEIALARKPIIATDAGSICDMVTPQTGIIVEQRNAKQIADAIERLIQDKDLAVALSSKVYDRACQLFDIDRNVGEIESLIIN